MFWMLGEENVSRMCGRVVVSGDTKRLLSKMKIEHCF